MAHDRLNHCRVRLFVHQKARETVSPKIVKPETAQPVSFFAEEFGWLFDQDSGTYRCGPKAIPNQYGGTTRLFAAQLGGRKDIIIVGSVHGLTLPPGEDVQCEIRNFHAAPTKP